MSEYVTVNDFMENFTFNSKDVEYLVSLLIDIDDALDVEIIQGKYLPYISKIFKDMLIQHLYPSLDVMKYINSYDNDIFSVALSMSGQSVESILTNK